MYKQFSLVTAQLCWELSVKVLSHPGNGQLLSNLIVPTGITLASHLRGFFSSNHCDVLIVAANILDHMWTPIWNASHHNLSYQKSEISKAHEVVIINIICIPDTALGRCKDD